MKIRSRWSFSARSLSTSWKKVELKFIIMVQDFDDAMYFVDKQGKRRDAVDHNVVRAFEDFTGLIKFSPQIGSFVVNTVQRSPADS